MPDLIRHLWRMSAKIYYVYILTNKSGTLYTGVTNNLKRRSWEHKYKIHESFTEKYNVDKLIYFEEYKNIDDAITREKQLKNWHRQWKINLIKKVNPNFEEIDIN